MSFQMAVGARGCMAVFSLGSMGVCVCGCGSVCMWECVCHVEAVSDEAPASVPPCCLGEMCEGYSSSPDSLWQRNSTSVKAFYTNIAARGRV